MSYWLNLIIFFCEILAELIEYWPVLCWLNSWLNCGCSVMMAEFIVYWLDCGSCIMMAEFIG